MGSTDASDHRDARADTHEDVEGGAAPVDDADRAHRHTAPGTPVHPGLVVAAAGLGVVAVVLTIGVLVDSLTGGLVVGALCGGVLASWLASMSMPDTTHMDPSVMHHAGQSWFGGDG